MYQIITNNIIGAIIIIITIIITIIIIIKKIYTCEAFPVLYKTVQEKEGQEWLCSETSHENTINTNNK
jgi:hypothetical protein